MILIRPFPVSVAVVYLMSTLTRTLSQTVMMLVPMIPPRRMTLVSVVAASLMTTMIVIHGPTVKKSVTMTPTSDTPVFVVVVLLMLILILMVP
jgi:hypothetical protein